MAGVDGAAGNDSVRPLEAFTKAGFQSDQSVSCPHHWWKGFNSRCRRGFASGAGSFRAPISKPVQSHPFAVDVPVHPARDIAGDSRLLVGGRGIRDGHADHRRRRQGCGYHPEHPASQQKPLTFFRAMVAHPGREYFNAPTGSNGSPSLILLGGAGRALLQGDRQHAHEHEHGLLHPRSGV